MSRMRRQIRLSEAQLPVAKRPWAVLKLWRQKDGCKVQRGHLGRPGLSAFLFGFARNSVLVRRMNSSAASMVAVLIDATRLRNRAKK